MEDNSLLEQNEIDYEENGSFDSKGEEIEYIPPKSTPLPFVLFENGKFVIPKQAKDLLTKQKLNNIGVISLVGKYRTGKSFLLNKVILNSKLGFDVGPTIKPCTKGIWIWSDPIMITNKNFNESFPCFIIDTEGLGAYDEEINQDTKIYLIAILISSLFIYNSFGPIDEPAIETLSFIINLGKTIKLKNSSNKNDEDKLIEYFPSLFWLLRDFSLKLEDKNGNTITSKEYLEIALEHINGFSEIIEQKNNVRDLIKTYFPERDCFTMVRPVENEKDLQKMNQLPENSFRKEFLDQIKMFRNKVQMKCRPKIFMNNTLTGEMLVQLVQSVLDSINDGCIPVIENSWKYIVRNECIKSSNDYLQRFQNEIKKYRNLNKNDPNFIQKVKTFTSELSGQYINSFLKNKLFDNESKKEFQDKLKGKLNEEVERFNRENVSIFRDNFQKTLNNEANQFIEDIEGKNKDKYKKSYYKFFEDLDEFREKMDKYCPTFSGKNDLLFDKIIEMCKKYFEKNYINNKEEIEEELRKSQNQVNTFSQKLNLANNELFKLKKSNGDALNKLNSDVISEKRKNKNLEDKINVLLNEKKITEDNYERVIAKMKDDFKNEISKITNLKNQKENDLNIKEKEIEVMKLKNAKNNTLQNQKLKFFEKEIINLREKNNHLSLESKNKEETLINEIKLLQSKIDDLKNQKEIAQNDNLDLYKSIMNNINEVKCNKCLQSFKINDFKYHLNNCMNNNNIYRHKYYKSWNDGNNLNFNPKYLKIKILKINIKEDEIGKAYLNYIIDIKYNGQNWRINKKFNEFIYLFNAIQNIFNGIINLSQYRSIFLNIQKGGTSFYKNKIFELEKFLIDLSNSNPINTSKPFLKFLEFKNNYNSYNSNYYNRNILNIEKEDYNQFNIKKPYETLNYDKMNDNESIDYDLNNRSTSI